MPHWSYTENVDGDLAQGDILLPGAQLTETLHQVHPWFEDPKYLGFIVISQTCDLVRRDGRFCKTPYVEIAAIRGLRSYSMILLRSGCDWIGDRYFPLSERSRANDLLDRVINQNESGLGLFYLHPEASIGLAEEAVALLRVSIALRSDEHYEALLQARRGRLAAEFANKLGWICGNLYSRIGVKDWKETENDKRTARAIISSLLEEGDHGPKFIECPKAFLDAFKKRQFDLSQSTPEEIEAKLAEYPATAFKDRALDVVQRILTDAGIDVGLRGEIREALRSDTEFAGTVRPGKK
jgi:hypothetical protein